MKLSMETLKERADAVASEELLSTISGGTENACHDAARGPKGILHAIFDIMIGRN